MEWPCDEEKMKIQTGARPPTHSHAHTHTHTHTHLFSRLVVLLQFICANQTHSTTHIVLHEAVRTVAALAADSKARREAVK